jgi:hypothetical protein
VKFAMKRYTYTVGVCASEGRYAPAYEDASDFVLDCEDGSLCASWAFDRDELSISSEGRFRVGCSVYCGGCVGGAPFWSWGASLFRAGFCELDMGAGAGRVSQDCHESRVVITRRYSDNSL